MSLHLYLLFFCFSHGKKTGSATGKYNQWTGSRENLYYRGLCIL